jgi:hypothetical protein
MEPGEHGAESGQGIGARNYRRLSHIRSMAKESGELTVALSTTTKLRVAHSLWETAWALSAAGVKARHPELAEQDVNEKVREIFRRGES